MRFSSMSILSALCWMTEPSLYLDPVTPPAVASDLHHPSDHRAGSIDLPRLILPTPAPSSEPPQTTDYPKSLPHRLHYQNLPSATGSPADAARSDAQLIV